MRAGTTLARCLLLPLWVAAMLGPDGLYGHIRANRWRSAFLLAAFVVLVALFWLGWCILYSALIEHWLLAPKRRYNPTLLDVLGRGLHYAGSRWWVPIVGATAWFTIAYLLHADMIRLATGARGVERRHAKALYNRVERLAIAAGLPMPAVQIIPTSALNAYAAGLTPDASVVAVTQGLLDTLSPDELDAVIAHEIAHIKHRDVQLMTVATCFAGGLTLVGSGVAKWWAASSSGDEPISVLASGGRAASRREGPPAAVIAGIVIGVLCLALAHIFALVIKFALSRSREFLADAGAVELTKNPDALIRALRKISANDQIEDLDPTVEAMMISATAEHLFSTHPPIEDRVGALVRHAGGRETVARSASISASRRPARFLPERPVPAASGAAMPFAAPSLPRRRRNFLDASRA